MKKIILAIAGIVLSLLCLWWWQATQAERFVSFQIPRWVMGETNLNVSYSVAIHKSQVNPWWTVWKATYYPTPKTKAQ